MKPNKFFLDAPSPSAKPSSVAGKFRILDRDPPPDHEEFKALRSFGLKGLRAKLEARRKKK